MVIQNRHWIETAVSERPFLATKLSEKAAAEARLTAFRDEFDDFARQCSATGSRLLIRDIWSRADQI